MTRVGFLHPSFGEAWLGGISYFRNLFGALAVTPGCGITPVLLAPRRTRPRADFAGVETVRSHVVELRELFVVRGVRHWLQSDPLLEWLLARHDVRVLSHSGLLGRRARTPVIAWVADLQHRALPQFFQPAELTGRDAWIRSTLRQASRVVLSSEATRADFLRWFPGAEDKLRVVRFVHFLAPHDSLPTRRELETRYGFSGPYLLLPNQYWAHKNHRVVLEAQGLLARRGRPIQILSTGNTTDYRNPGNFEAIMRLRAELGLEQLYRVLGVVPFRELTALFRNAVAVVNPSLFEGWSTTVEEAKSLGKTVVLSDLAVHREQAPESALFFDPHDPEELAEALWRAWDSHDPEADRRAADRASAALPIRQREFAHAYASVVREVLPARRPAEPALDIHAVAGRR